MGGSVHVAGEESGVPGASSRTDAGATDGYADRRSLGVGQRGAAAPLEAGALSILSEGNLSLVAGSAAASLAAAWRLAARLRRRWLPRSGSQWRDRCGRRSGRPRNLAEEVGERDIEACGPHGVAASIRRRR